MKILLITEHWEPEVGGIQRYLKGLVNELVEGGDEIDVVVPRNKFQNSSNENLGIIRRRFYWPVVKPSWWPLYRWVRRKVRREKYDYIFCGKGLFEGRLARRIYKQAGVKYVVFTYAKEVNEWLEKGKTKRQLRKVVGNASYIVGINDMVRNKLIIEVDLHGSKYVKLTPGLDDFWFEVVDNDEVTEILNKCEIKKPYVLSVGRLQARKGFDDLIEAFGKLDQVKFEDYQLVIVGDGPEEEKLQEMVEQEWLSNNVIFLDDVNDQELRALYAGAELFALTPKKVGEDVEGFGIVYLEAAAQGVPVVGTDSGGVSEAVKDGETGIVVEEGDVGLIAEAMEKMLSDKNLRNKYGERAKRLARGQGWDIKVGVLKEKLG